MIGKIETACFHCSGGREMIYASKRDAEWIRQTHDIRDCFGSLINKESGSSVLMLSTDNNGVNIIIAKMIPNRFGDNLTAYLHIPNGLDVSGQYLQGAVFDVISALAQNRRDTVSACLGSISKEEFEQVPDMVLSTCSKSNYAFRKVSSDTNTSNSLCAVLNDLYQEDYAKYKYILLAIDGQVIANEDTHTDLTSAKITSWRPKEESAKQETTSLDNEASSCFKGNVYDSQETNENETILNRVNEYSSEWLKENTNIHGWLSFFLFAIMAGGLFSAIYALATFKIDDYAGNYCLGSVDIVTGILLFAIACYTLYAFVNRKPNAIFWGRVYVMLIFVTNIFILIGGTEGDGLQSTKQVVRGVIWAVIWFLYLAFSNQVKEIIPTAFRKASKTDWGILAVVLLLPVLLFFTGLNQINALVDSRTNQEMELKNAVLSYNQRTDGRVIFTIPDGFTCEKNDVDVEGTTITLFSIENEEVGSCTMCSDYDTDKSNSNFDSYWTGWKDDESSRYRSENIDRGTLTINENKCLYRITRYNVNGSYVYWRFYLLFNDETGKVFIASFYDTDYSTYYVNELLESVKFK